MNPSDAKAGQHEAFKYFGEQKPEGINILFKRMSTRDQVSDMHLSTRQSVGGARITISANAIAPPACQDNNTNTMMSLLYTNMVYWRSRKYKKYQPPLNKV